MRERSTMPKLLILLMLFFLMIGCAGIANATVTVESLKESIARDLPLGSSKERIMTFLDEQHLGGGTYSSKTNAVYAIVRNVRQSFLIRTDIQMIFYLDAEGKLKQYTVKEVHTGP